MTGGEGNQSVDPENDAATSAKDEINVPIALSAFRDNTSVAGTEIISWKFRNHINSR